MRSNITKREFLQIFSIGGVAAAMGLLTGTNAEARKLPPGETLAQLAQAISSVSFIAGLGFVVAAIIKFEQQKNNPTQSPYDPLRLVSAVWASIDDSIAESLYAAGYSPNFILDAVVQANNGDATGLTEFFSEVERLAQRCEG
jgi:hypothetical protein